MEPWSPACAQERSFESSVATLGNYLSNDEIYADSRFEELLDDSSQIFIYHLVQITCFSLLLCFLSCSLVDLKDCLSYSTCNICGFFFVGLLSMVINIVCSVMDTNLVLIIVKLGEPPCSRARNVWCPQAIRCTCAFLPT